MAKHKALPPGELKLLSWRTGVTLGSAIDRHRTAHWHLQQKSAEQSAHSGTPDIHVPTALANEVGMMQDFEACTRLAKTLGVKLAPLEECERCRTLFYRANRLSEEDKSWLPGFVESVDKGLEGAYATLKEYFRESGEAIVALFDFAVRASMATTSPDDPANLSTIAATAGLGTEVVSLFVCALSQRTDPDGLRKELARLNKSVERALLYGR